jgi:hypothetical protein
VRYSFRAPTQPFSHAPTGTVERAGDIPRVGLRSRGPIPEDSGIHLCLRVVLDRPVSPRFGSAAGTAGWESRASLAPLASPESFTSRAP